MRAEHWSPAGIKRTELVGLAGHGERARPDGIGGWHRPLTRGRCERPSAPDAQPERGSATVELALLLPLLFSLVLLVVQAGLVLRDQLLVVGAAREVARAAAIDGNRDVSSTLPYPGLNPERLLVTVVRNGPYTTATLRYRSEIVLPLLRATLPDIDLEAELTMRDEEVSI